MARQKKLTQEQVDLATKNHEFVVTMVIAVIVFLIGAIMFRVYGDGAIVFIIFGEFVTFLRYAYVTEHKG